MDSIYIIRVSDTEDFSHSDVLGWYEDKDKALNVVKNNICDIWETCYDWACIDEIPRGLYPSVKRRWIFKVNPYFVKNEKVDLSKTTYRLVSEVTDDSVLRKIPSIFVG